MLNLLDPVVLEGVTLYRDDEDVRKFYVLPDAPTISTDEDGDPEFLFLMYRFAADTIAEGGQQGGGYVQFRCTLTLTPDRRARLVEQLTAQLVEEQARGARPFGKPVTDTTPMLANPQWTAGKVALETFEVSETSMVRKAAGSTAPDLGGDLGASYAVHLDAAGAALFKSAFETDTVPIIIAYELTYKARVPAARMVIHAERTTVEERIWSVARPHLYHAGLRVYRPLAIANAYSRLEHVRLQALHGPALVPLVSRSELRRTVSTNITVDIQLGEGGGEAEGDLRQKLLDIAAEVLTESVVPSFCEPGEVPAEATEGGARESMQRLKPEPDRTQETFHMELSEEIAVDRHANPNGPVRVLLPEGYDRSRAFREVPLDDPFFALKKLVIGTAGVKFEQDGIDAIHVWVDYNRTEPTGIPVKFAKDAVLRDETESLRWQFHVARKADGTHDHFYRMRTAIHYRGLRDPVLTEWVTTSDNMPLITPRTMGALRVDLVLTAQSKTVESVEVALRHQASTGLFEDTLALSPTENRKSWMQYTGDFPATTEASLEQPAYEYRVTWRLAAGGQIVGDWTETQEDVLEIPSPFTDTLVFTLRPQGWSPGTVSIGGDVAYDDEAHGYHVVASFQLDKVGASFVFTVPVLRGAPRAITVRGLRVAEATTARDLPDLRAEPGTVLVGEAPPEDQLTVMVNPMLVDFDTDVQLAIVELSYRDATGAVARSETLTFMKDPQNGHRQPKTWIVSLPDRDHRSFGYVVRYKAYDPAKDSEVRVESTTDPLVLLDRRRPVP